MCWVNDFFYGSGWLWAKSGGIWISFVWLRKVTKQFHWQQWCGTLHLKLISGCNILDLLNKEWEIRRNIFFKLLAFLHFPNDALTAASSYSASWDVHTLYGGQSSLKGRNHYNKKVWVYNLTWIKTAFWSADMLALPIWNEQCWGWLDILSYP